MATMILTFTNNTSPLRALTVDDINSVTTLTVSSSSSSPQQFPVVPVNTTWVIYDSDNVQYNIYPPVTSAGDNLSLTITEPCVVVCGTTACITFNNTTSNNVSITNIPPPNNSPFPTFVVMPGTQQTTLPLNSVWQTPDGTFTVTNTTGTIPLIDIVTHTYATSYKKNVSTSAGMWGLTGSFYACALIFAICFMFSKKTIPPLPKEDSAIFDVITATSSNKFAHECFYGFFILVFLSIAIFFTIVILMGNFKTVTCEQCLAKGAEWKWAIPTNTDSWQQKAANKIFGSGQCVSDELATACSVFALSHQGYAWDGAGAAISTSGACFCCDDSTCVDVTQSGAICIRV